MAGRTATLLIAVYYLSLVSVCVYGFSVVRLKTDDIQGGYVEIPTDIGAAQLRARKALVDYRNAADIDFADYSAFDHKLSDAEVDAMFKGMEAQLKVKSDLLKFEAQDENRKQKELAQESVGQTRIEDLPDKSLKALVEQDEAIAELTHVQGPMEHSIGMQVEDILKTAPANLTVKAFAKKLEVMKEGAKSRQLRDSEKEKAVQVKFDDLLPTAGINTYKPDETVHEYVLENIYEKIKEDHDGHWSWKVEDK